MALSSTLFRFRIELSDIDRPLYRSFDLRIARHPSENDAYLLTRILAYALSFEEELELAPGLCADDEPALFIRDLQGGGGYRKWIEIGNPSARRLHKASKASARVEVYTYKDPSNLVREVRGQRVHRVEAIRVFAFSAAFLESLAAALARDNNWTIFKQEGDLTVVVGEESFSAPVTPVRLEP